MLNFLQQKNLTCRTLEQGAPWDFYIPPEQNSFRRMPKAARRVAMLSPQTSWNCYTAFRGVDARSRISKENPVVAISGLVIDYDAVMDVAGVLKLLDGLSEKQHPNFIEKTLSMKNRLVWVFEREILIPSPAFAHALMETFVSKMGLDVLLPGYDAASLKPTEMWTNGAEWHTIKETPLSWEFCFGVVCAVSQKVSLFNRGEIPLETIAEEVTRRHPGRWQGDFKLDAIGIRFWDEKADNPTGCQVKPDGMLCFTGKVPFMRWEDLFGRAWVEEKKILNLGAAGKDIYFDDKCYWEYLHNRWCPVQRIDVQLRLTEKGISDVRDKGQTISDVGRVLAHIQKVNLVEGAAPLINYPPGLIIHEGHRLLNTSDLRPVRPVAGTGKPEIDCPWIWEFLKGLFPRSELMPREHFLAWLQRSYRVVLEHRRFMGQALFICGPKNNGKTLLCTRIVRPLMGGKMANPINFMTGQTTFNDDLFESALLAINDEDAPANEAERGKMLAKLKGLVVNPKHSHHAKFNKKVTIDWTGRIIVTLNDDPASVGMLMEVNANTRDKQMNFATQAYKGAFPEQTELEAILERELPYFAHILLNYKPPAEVLSDDRMGVKSFFDPHILRLAVNQTYSSNLLELLITWQRVDAYWADKKNVDWVGTPTDLLQHLSANPEMTNLVRNWDAQKFSRNLTALARQENSPVVHVSDTSRQFKIVRASETADGHTIAGGVK